MPAPKNDVINYLEDPEQNIYEYPEVSSHLRKRKIKKREIIGKGINKNVNLLSGDVLLSGIEFIPRELLKLPIEVEISDQEPTLKDKINSFKQKLLTLCNQEKPLFNGLSRQEIDKLRTDVEQINLNLPDLSTESSKIAAIKKTLEDEKVSIMAPGTLEIIIGDLHGNFLKLIYTLMREGVISGISKEDYKSLGKLLKKPYDKITAADQRKYSEIIDKIIIDPSSKIKLTLIGDVLRDRGPSDSFTLELIAKLTTAPGNKKLEMDIIWSNHDFAFFRWYQKIQSDPSFQIIKELEDAYEKKSRSLFSIDFGPPPELVNLRKKLYNFQQTLDTGQENSNEAVCRQLREGLLSTTQFEKWANVYFSKLKLFSHSKAINSDGSSFEKIKMHAQPNGLQVLQDTATWLLTHSSEFRVSDTDNRGILTDAVNKEFQARINLPDTRKTFCEESVYDVTRGFIQEVLRNYKTSPSKFVSDQSWIISLEESHPAKYAELQTTPEYKELVAIIINEINALNPFIPKAFKKYCKWQNETNKAKKTDAKNKFYEMLELNAELKNFSLLNYTCPEITRLWNEKAGIYTEIGRNLYRLLKEHQLTKDIHALKKKIEAAKSNMKTYSKSKQLNHDFLLKKYTKDLESYTKRLQKFRDAYNSREVSNQQDKIAALSALKKTEAIVLKSTDICESVSEIELNEYKPCPLYSLIWERNDQWGKLCLMSEVKDNNLLSDRVYLLTQDGNIIKDNKIKYRTKLTSGEEFCELKIDSKKIDKKSSQALCKSNLTEITLECKEFFLNEIIKRKHIVVDSSIQFFYGHVGGYRSANPQYINTDSGFGKPEEKDWIEFLKPGTTDRIYSKSTYYRVGYGYDEERYKDLKTEYVCNLMDYNEHLQSTLTKLAGKLTKKADDLPKRTILFEETLGAAETAARSLVTSLESKAKALKKITLDDLLKLNSISELEAKLDEMNKIKEASVGLLADVMDESKDNPLIKERGFLALIKHGIKALGKKIFSPFTAANDITMAADADASMVENSDENAPVPTITRDDSEKSASIKTAPYAVLFHSKTKTKTGKKIQDGFDELNKFETFIRPTSRGIKTN